MLEITLLTIIIIVLFILYFSLRCERTPRVYDRPVNCKQSCKKCLVVVDFQNDFVDGSLGFSGAERLEPVILRKIKKYLKEGHDVVFTLDTHDDDYLESQEGERLPVEHVVRNTRGHQIYGRVRNYLPCAEAIFIKYTFGSYELGEYLREKCYDEIELCGLVSHICVLSNAIIAKAALPEARIVVDSNATDSADKELHQKTLDVLRGVQVDIIS